MLMQYHHLLVVHLLIYLILLQGTADEADGVDVDRHDTSDRIE